MPLTLLGTFTAAEGAGNLTSGSRTTVAGSLVTIHAGNYVFGGSAAAPTLLDNKSNSFTSSTHLQFVNGSDNTGLRTAYNLNGTRGTSHTVSGTFTTAAQTLVGHEWAGVAASPSIAFTNNTGTGTAASVTASASVPSGYIGTTAYTGTATTFAPNNATEASETDENSDFQAQGVAYRQSLTGSNSVAWTLAASRTWGANLMVVPELSNGAGEAGIGPVRGPATDFRIRRHVFLTQSGTTYNQSVSGGLSFTGVLQRQTNKQLIGGLSFVGALQRQTNKNLVGGLSFAGALQKQSSKGLAGVLSFGGALQKQTNKLLAGVLSFNGTMAAAKVTLQSIVGVLSFSGALQKQTNKALAGAVSFAGVMQRQTNKVLAGAVSFSGGLARSMILQKAVSGVLSFAGALSTLFTPGGGVVARWFLKKRARRDLSNL